MQDFREEKIMGKAYDSRLMKRLLEYAYPYWKILLVCIFLLLIVTGIELARPYLIKIAIDDHINALDKPMVVYNSEQYQNKGTVYNNKRYIRVDNLDGDYSDQTKYQLYNFEGNYYLIEGLIDDKLNIKLINPGQIRNGNIILNAVLLDNDDITNFRKQDYSALAQIGIIFLIIIVLGFGINYLQIFLLNKTTQKIIYNMRQEIFSHLQKMSLSYFDKNPVGRLVTRVTNDTETLNEMYTNVLVNLFKDIFIIFGIVIIMFRLNIKLSLVSLVIVPFVIAAAFIFRSYARDAYRMVRIKLAKINSALSENISGMKIVQIFNQEKRKLSEFININNEYYKASMRQIKIFAIFRPSMDLLYSLALAILIWYGGARVYSETLQFGVLYAFINYIQKFFRPINDLSEKYNMLQSAMASSERIFKILDTNIDIKNPENPVQLPEEIEGKVEFKDVWFAYQKDEWVLKDINFTINPGETVALVGATGAGKTSIINLISRFYDIQRGKILIDDTDITNIKKSELRKRIGVVLQDVFLFTGDIGSNISLNADIDKEKIKKTAQYVNADKFITRLNNNYDHEVKERGSTLSAGQKQLLAFARALAFDPEILVLDEATANIDTETEILIQEALERLTSNRTTIVIAHRLSTIQHADKILVLHKGKIKERGNHQDLLAKKGLYYNLYQLQYKEQVL
ncbi:MAG: ABC transporter ATP-binding protein/permease [Halanaerobiales bacterium]|nr:ABC transporter ATP-binding protein/permease [Halanaerobiales bacterium]